MIFDCLMYFCSYKTYAEDILYYEAVHIIYQYMDVTM